MRTITRSLIILTALVSASAAFAAGGQFRDRAQLKDGSCIALDADGTATGCPRLADQDQFLDRDQVKLRDGSCLDGTGVPARDGSGLKARTRTRAAAAHAKGVGGPGAR